MLLTLRIPCCVPRGFQAVWLDIYELTVPGQPVPLREATSEDNTCTSPSDIGEPDLNIQLTMGFLSVDEQEIMKGLRPILQQAIDRADWRINEFEDLVAHVAMILRWDLQKTTNVLRGDILRFAGNIEALAAGALVLLAVWLAVYIYREMKREGREREYHAERMRALRGADPNATSYDLVSLPAESMDLFDELAQASRRCGGYLRWILSLL